jgi:hypothetical protein
MNNTTSGALVPFDFEGSQIRVFTDEQGDPWFVGADVCSVLGIGNPRQAMSRLDEDERGVISTPGSLPTNKQDSVGALLLIGQAVARVPGVKPGIAMAATLTCIQENTGLALRSLRRTLPAPSHSFCSCGPACCSCRCEATQLAEHLVMTAQEKTTPLVLCGPRHHNARRQWGLEP